MQEKIFIRPAEGATVRDPENLADILSPEGREVEKSIQWIRYLRDGDVVLVEKDKKSKGETK